MQFRVAPASSLDDAHPSPSTAASSRAPWGSAEDHLADLMDFVVASPSSYHAADVVARRLVAAGATRIEESDAWPSAPGAYVLVRGGAAVAWVVPEEVGRAGGDDRTGGASETTAADRAAFRIVGSHTDSPGFRVKPNPNTGAAGYAQVAVEVYGGPLLGAWTDREIEFAGRVVTRDGGVHLARTGPVARIPQLAIHLNRGVNDQGLKLDKQRHTTPVIGYSGDARAFTTMLADAANAAANAAADTSSAHTNSANTNSTAASPSGEVSAVEIRGAVGGTPMQARAALNRLIEDGKIKYSGRARSTKYFS